MLHICFPGGIVLKYLPPNEGDARDRGSIPRSGRYPGVGNGNPLQYSCPENSMNGAAWWDTVHGVKRSGTRLSDFTFTFHISKIMLKILQARLQQYMNCEFPDVQAGFIYLFFFKFYFIFKLYIIVLALPNIKMNPPQVYMCSPS